MRLQKFYIFKDRLGKMWNTANREHGVGSITLPPTLYCETCENESLYVNKKAKYGAQL